MTARSARRLQWLGHAVLGIAVLMLCAYAYRALLAQLPPVHADEAGHVLPAARMALALKHGHLGEFFAATRREVMWPFFHPWFITPFFLACGIDTVVARTSSLVAFAAALCLVPAFAREIARRDVGAAGGPATEAAHATAGWLSVAVLVGSAQWLLICTVMSESLGMTLTLVTLLVEARSLRRGRLAEHAACGVLAALTFFTKYSYGLPLMAAVLAAGIWRLGRHGWRAVISRLLAMTLPVLLWLAWQLYPDLSRGSELLAAIVNRDEGLRGLAGLLFYPRTLLEWLGWPAALVVLAALVVGVGRALRGRGLASALFVLFTLAMLTLHPNKQTRYVLMVFPVLLVLAETELALRLLRCVWRDALWIGIALVLVGDPVGAIRVQAEDAAQLRGAHAILDFISAHVAPGQSVLCLGTTGRLPHFALSWQLLERDGREPQVDLLLFPGETGDDQRYRSGYPTEMRPEYERALREALSGGLYVRVVTLEFAEGSPFLPDWLAKWDKWSQNYVRCMPLQDGWSLRAEQTFPGSGARVRVYARRERGSGEVRPLHLVVGAGR